MLIANYHSPPLYQTMNLQSVGARLNNTDETTDLAKQVLCARLLGIAVTVSPTTSAVNKAGGVHHNKIYFSEAASMGQLTSFFHVYSQSEAEGPDHIIGSGSQHATTSSRRRRGGRWLRDPTKLSGPCRVTNQDCAAR